MKQELINRNGEKIPGLKTGEIDAVENPQYI
jgi:hypothetical protein